MRVLGRFMIAAVVLSGCQIQEQKLSTTEQLAVTVNPPPAFPNTPVGSTSAPISIEVRPLHIEDSSDQVVAVTENCPDFDVSAPDLPAPVSRKCIASTNCTQWEYVTYKFSAVFRPAVGQTVTCPVTISLNNETKYVTLTGTGTVPSIDIDVQPTTIAFGDTRINRVSTAAIVTVRNLGGTTLTVSSTSISAGFASAGPIGPYPLASNTAASYSLTCNPLAVGGITGQFEVDSNDPSTPAITIPLSCNGIDTLLDITPSPAILPSTAIGQPVSRSITLTNSDGVAAMTIVSAVVTDPAFTIVSAPPPNTVLPALGGSAQVVVGFAAEARGEASGELVVTYNAGQTRRVALGARALTTSMALNPDGVIDLGPACIAQTVRQSVKVLANNEGSFFVTSITTPTPPFTVTKGTVPLNVQGSGTNQVIFSVNATPTDPGPATSTVSVVTDIPSSSPRDLTVNVEGLTAGVNASPALLDFGPGPLGATRIGENVHIINCTTQQVALVNARIEGTHASDFAIVQQPPSLDLAPNGNASWLVVASVKELGLREAIFAVDTPLGTTTMQLNAEGLAIGDGNDDGRSSYYTCSTGTSAASWPLGLALLVALRRRRTRGESCRGR